MKKKLVAYLLVSALAVTALIGCGKKGGDADAADFDVEATTEAEAVADGAAEEFVDDEADAAVTGEAAAAKTEEDVIVDPGTQYTVRFGGNIYASMDQNDANVIDYVYPGYILNINERLDDYWYHVTYWIDGAARSGYIKIQ